MSEQENALIRELNALTEEQKIARVKKVVKANNWKMFLNEDSKNFHVIANNGIRICREEYKDLLKGNIIQWSCVEHGKRVISDFGTLVVYFCNALVQSDVK